MQQAPGDISEAEYQVLAEYFLNDCSTVDKLIDKATKEAVGKVTGPVGIVIDAVQAYDEALEQNALETRMINQNNASHACEDFGATGYYVEVTTNNVFHWSWVSEKKDYYIQPTWDLHQSESSNENYRSTEMKITTISLLIKRWKMHLSEGE